MAAQPKVTPQREPGSVVAEPATVDACRRDYDAAKDARASFDEHAQRYYRRPASDR
ncbi:hypothetical protein ACWCWD_06425 [Streptomyces sp. NPDC001493]